MIAAESVKIYSDDSLSRIGKNISLQIVRQVNSIRSSTSAYSNYIAIFKITNM